MDLLWRLVKEVHAADHRRRVLTDREPCLRLRAKIEIVRRAPPTHLGGDPTWVDGIGPHVRPAPRQGKSQRCVEQLGIRIRLRPVPPTATPLQVSEVRIATPMHTGAQIDKTLRSSYQRGQQVRAEHVDGKDVLETIDGLEPAFAVTDSRVVNDRVARP